MKHSARPLRAVYNFFNMFHKDKGAHFTYNIGVSMMRVGLLCFLFAVFLAGEFFLLDTPRIRRRDSVKAEITDCSLIDSGDGTIGYVSFSGVDREGNAFRATQHCTYGGYHYYRTFLKDGERHDLTRYRVKGRGDYITYHLGIFVGYEYHWAYPDTSPPVPLWGIPVSLLLMLLFFYMGKKQISISMKYPRSDIPKEITGAPVLSPGSPDSHTVSEPELLELRDHEPTRETDKDHSTH